MTTKDEIFNQAKEIVDQFKATLPENLFINYSESRSYSHEETFSFVGDPTDSWWSAICKLSLSIPTCAREESDIDGFFTKQAVIVTFYSRTINSNDRAFLEKKINVNNKAFELMGLLTASLPTEYIERGETHAEREESNKIRRARAHCVNVVTSNSKHMRIESGKVLPPAPNDIRLGDYNVIYNEKTFKVSLSVDSTTLVRVD